MKKLGKIEENRVLELRSEAHLTQADLSKALGVHQCTVSSWENQRSQPTLSATYQLMQFFNCDLDTLFVFSQK